MPRRKYHKKAGSLVAAVQLDLDTEGFTYEKWGGTQTCKAGDWLVDNDGDVYTVDGETFTRTYRRVSSGVYEKTAPVWAEVAKQAGHVNTKEGVTRYKAGAYIVYNDPDGEDAYAIDADSFQKMYEAAPAKTARSRNTKKPKRTRERTKSEDPRLRFGSKGPEVAKLVELLTKRGCPPTPPVTAARPKFGRAVENMVLYFQMTHQGPDGEWLTVDGVVGEDTWWALRNHAGPPQRSFLEAGIPKGITERRRKVLETAVKEHGIREDPRRPNRGKEVDKFLPTSCKESSAQDGKPWCCFFTSWVTKQALGEYPLGAPLGSCYAAWRRAEALGQWERKRKGRVPTPGDAFVILHKDPAQGWCTGHIGFVLQVSRDGKSINTVEGNCGNRVKIGRRKLSDPSLRGFINFYGDHPEFKRGSLRGAKDLGKRKTR